ncbi:metallophosphoesterase [Dyadobacter sp. CY261]|uniref:metallophosphoesterase n=1 Tax=Dyadobacter sp. CY261 TaxID=2907203 RepID=UPI001F3A1690|nr:metallophosphoesterase [Dyadobacter sp. CY261]MCF0074902.1 metallophosphoesterase [Dyadobacter sp. CY261]
MVQTIRMQALAVFFCFISLVASAQKQRPFFFIQMTDSQFGFFTDNKSFEKETENFEKAITAANRLRPAFVVITGDLINKPADKAQMQEYKRIVALLDPAIPIYHVAGNHDVTNDPKESDIATYRNELGKDYYLISHQNMRGIVLNSLYFKSPGGVEKEAAAQAKWLNKQLKKARRSSDGPLLIFQHHSWFLNDPGEKDEYFNIPISTREKYMALFKQYGVSHIFAGHYHRNAFGKSGDIEMVTTGPVGKPLGKDPSGFRIVKVSGNNVSHQYYELDQVPDRIVLE